MQALIAALQQVQHQLETTDFTRAERATVSRWYVPVDRAYHRLMGVKAPVAEQTGLPPTDRCGGLAALSKEPSYVRRSQ